MFPLIAFSFTLYTYGYISYIKRSKFILTGEARSNNFVSFRFERLSLSLLDIVSIQIVILYIDSYLRWKIEVYMYKLSEIRCNVW